MVLIAGSAQAQWATVNGPTLGFTSDNAGTAIRPIIGIPGASLLAERLPLETNIHGAGISPRQDYAIAVRTEDGQVIVIDLQAGGISTVAGTHSGADLTGISPTGSVAAVYDHESRTVQVIRHLPAAPEVIHQFDASHIPGLGTSLAVSDDGTIALMRFVEEESAALWVMDSSGASWPLSTDRPSAAAFLPNSSDAIIAEDATQSAFLAVDLRGAATRMPLIAAEEGITAFASVAASEDGRRVFLADVNSGNIAIVDMETRRHELLSCQCAITGFHRLKGTSVFRLNEVSRQPVMVLDASGTEPRIVVIPPSATDVGEAQ
jgi:hypothetical protein